MANIVYSFLLALVSALDNAVCSTFISFVSVTTPTMRKTNNPYFGRVQKRTTASGVLFNATYWGSDENGNPLPPPDGKKPPKGCKCGMKPPKDGKFPPMGKNGAHPEPPKDANGNPIEPPKDANGKPIFPFRKPEETAET